jgi:glucan phosphoethanolaminetransferase (alkaline phosphatase superfamily)
MNNTQNHITFGNHTFGSGPMGMYMMQHPLLHGLFIGLIIVAVIWTLIWKGLALWNSARNHQKVWFIILLIVNTLGILEIIYLLFFRKNKNDLVTTTTVTHTTVASSPTASVVSGDVVE